MAKRKTHEEFINEMMAVNPNIKILGKYRNANTKILCKCKIDGYEWQARPGHLLRSHGCPECAGNRRKTHDEFVKELYAINPNIEVLGHYKSDGTKILYRCKIDNYKWMATPNNIIGGTGCPKCGEIKSIKSRTRTNEEFVEELKIINPNIQILSKYIRNNIKVKCKCKIDGHEWQALPSSLLFGRGCPKCGVLRSAKVRAKTHKEFIAELKKINPDIEVLGKYKTNNAKIKCKCLIDGNEWETRPIILLQGCGCPKCNASKGEKTIANYLETNRIPYKPQHSFKGCKYKQSLLFDFYLPTLNTAIEYDGQQHFEPVEIFGGEESFKEQQIKDNIKDSYCKKKGINLIRIPYTVGDIDIYLEEQLGLP